MCAASADTDFGGIILKEVSAQILSRDRRLEDSKIEAEFKNHAALSAYAKKQAGRISVKLDFPQNSRLAGNVVLPLSVYEKGKFKEKIFVQARIRIMKQIVMSSDKIRKGQAFTGSNLAYQEKDISIMPSAVIFDAASILGKESVTLIPKSSMILDWMARKIPDIKKGNFVTVYSVQGEVSASSACAALEDGYIGQKMRLKNPVSNKVLEAFAVSSLEARIR
ncbi:MAG: flagellar basal body P-ring formation chaperone FlgA [Candidatus Margulisiibacteriota bacterium]